MNQTGIMLERAESARHNTERKNWRVPTDFSITLNIIEEEEQHQAQMKDLTIDGALIKTFTDFQPGAMLNLKMKLPKSEPFTLLVQIVYSDPTTPDQQNRYGLRFVEVPKKAKDAFIWYLYEKIQEIYPQKLRDLYPRPPRKKKATS